MPFPSSSSPSEATVLVEVAPDVPPVDLLAARAVVMFAADLGGLVEVDPTVVDQGEETEDGIPAPEFADRAGITYRQLDHWTGRGYLAARPRADGAGSGYPRRYDADAVLKARIMGSLVRNLDMAPAAASATADEIVATGRAQVGPFTVTSRDLS